MDPREYFSQNLDKNESLAQLHASEVRQLSVIRIIVFVVFVILSVWLANSRMGVGLALTILTFPVVFGLVIRRFNQKTYQMKLRKTIVQRYREEMMRLDLSMEALDGGDSYLDREHPYSYDLDLFGKHSLFKLLNRTATPVGRSKLVAWMLNQAGAPDILLRQEAVSELRADPEWMIHFVSEGNADAEISSHTGDLKSWLEQPAGSVRIASSLAVLFALLFLFVLTGIIWFGLPLYAISVPVVINLFVLRRLQESVSRITRETSGNVDLLRGYERMFIMFKQRQFRSPMLLRLHEPFNDHAIRSIQSLRKHLDFLNARSNLFYAIIDLVFLTDVHLLNGLEKWKKAYRDDLTQWFENIGEVEALISLSLYAYSNPSNCIPEISTEEFCWEASGIGHPLIPNDERVANDFSLKKASPISIITGSNMSGKSTFLRTVGLNSVLAGMGAVVCARQMKISLSRIYTAMRTEDDLKSHISSFYAELRRIKGLLDSLGSQTTLCLLDEILKGTNTADRHRGAQGLLIQLSKQNVAGLVSTHDLELGRWGEDHDFTNFSFNSTIHGDRIAFDYQISDGVCRSFNASQLMKNMGIELPGDNAE